MRRLVAPLIALALCAGCATGAPSAADAPVVAAIIVKPHQSQDRAAVVSAVERAVGADAGVRYVRALSGDAHLLHLTAPATRQQVPALIERLRASGRFQYVELDSMMKTQ